MRVKLAYSVDIEEIIGEVSRLFDYVADKEYSVNNQVETIADLLAEERPEGAVALMQKMGISSRDFNIIKQRASRALAGAEKTSDMPMEGKKKKK